MRYGLGHIKEPAGQIRWPFAAHPATAIRASELPPTVIHAAFTPAVMDQGLSSACVFHAYAGAAYTTFNVARRALPFVPDPLTGYRFTRETERADGMVPPGPLTDSGSLPMLAMLVGERRGVVPWRAWTMEEVNREASVLDVEDAAACCLAGYSAFNPLSGTPISVQVQQAIAAGFTVTLASYVDETFERYTGGTLRRPQLPFYGSHYLFAHSYVTDGDGLRFCVRNSWGVDWGVEGDCWVSAEWMDATMDQYAMTLQRVAA
jgi:hypothetical protein